MSDVKNAMKSRSALSGSIRVSHNSRQFNDSFGSARDFRMQEAPYSQMLADHSLIEISEQNQSQYGLTKARKERTFSPVRDSTT